MVVLFAPPYGGGSGAAELVASALLKPVTGLMSVALLEVRPL